MRRRKGKNRVRFFFWIVFLLVMLSAVFYVGQGWWKDTPAVDKQDQQNVQQPPAAKVVHNICGDDAG